MSWHIDPMHTQVEFAVKHFGMMTVRGRFNEVTVRGTVAPENPVASSLDVTIDVASLNTHNALRDNDLRGSHFLELAKYPTITFRSARIEPAGKDRYTMMGHLTIKGITRPVTLRVLRLGEINDPVMGHRVAYSAEGEINRKDFGMSFEMLADGKVIVAHEVKLLVDVEVIEQAPPQVREQPIAVANA